MALTSEILRANAATAALTDEQITAIVTMSQNDENSVIGQKIGEIYGGLDADILAASGIAKNGTEKTYDYAKRVIGEIKSQVGSVAELTKQVSTLTAEKTRLEGIIAKGGSDEETKRRLATVQADFDNVTKQFNDLKTQYDAKEQEYNTKLFDLQLNNEFAAATSGIKFKADLPKSATDVLLAQAVARVKGMNPQYIDNGAGGKVLAFMENGAVKRNPENNLNPFTAGELLAKELQAMGVLDTGRKQTGAGSQGGFNGGNGGTGGANVDIAGAKTQSEAYDIIAKGLMQQGLVLGSQKFEDEMQKAWKDNNVKALPVK